MSEINQAVNFEYEWLNDGSFRLRFLDRDDHILGQQIVATDSLNALSLLVVWGAVSKTDTEPQRLLELLSNCGVETDVATAVCLKEATRIRVGITPEGGCGLHKIDEDDEDDTELYDIDEE